MGIQMKGIRTDNVWVKAEGRGHQRGFDLKQELEANNCTTLPDILQLSAKKFGSSPSIGTRKLIERQRKVEGSKTFEKLVLGDYQWSSYEEVYETAQKVAAALKQFNLERGQRIAIFAETRAEWLILAIGCLRYGLTLVTLYSNLNDAGFIHGIKETEVDTLITSFDILPRLAKLLPECDCIKNLIVIEDELEGVGNCSNLPTYINLIPYSKLLTLGDPADLENWAKPEAEDNAIIMYTSGSTGTPKGVEITHKNIFHALIAYTVQADLQVGDRYIAYLPLAHVMELLTEMALIAMGVTIAYSSPLTLTNNSPKICKGTLGDAKVARPTAMTAVPLILDRVIKSVKQNVENQGKFKTKIFNEALKYKQGNTSGFTNKVLDSIIFNKVKMELGGNLKMMVVGGAPLSPQTHSMIKAMFGCVLQIGYGCTETTASCSSSDSDDPRVGHAGAPNPYVKVKLVDWDEGDYKTTDQPRPRGEIVVGGPCVAKGYFNLPNETAESFYDEDGEHWFRTGDVGEFDQTGVLYVIDRKKDLVKLNHGEYISLGNVESKLKTSNLVENICVFAEPGEDHTVAIVVPSAEPFKKLAAANGVTDVDDRLFEKLCLDEKGVYAMLTKLQSHGKQCGLSRFDIPQAIYLTPISWTPDNGLVTAALKLRRKTIQKEFHDQIKHLYKIMSNGKVC